jgi:hypothetical protein
VLRVDGNALGCEELLHLKELLMEEPLTRAVVLQDLLIDEGLNLLNYISIEDLI